MFRIAEEWKLYRFRRSRKVGSPGALAALCGMVLAASFHFSVNAQQTNPAAPVVVQPGAPGQPSKKLPPSNSSTKMRSR